jgi:hypothetical protein
VVSRVPGETKPTHTHPRKLRVFGVLGVGISPPCNLLLHQGPHNCVESRILKNSFVSLLKTSPNQVYDSLARFPPLLFWDVANHLNPSSVVALATGWRWGAKMLIPCED